MCRGANCQGWSLCAEVGRFARKVWLGFAQDLDAYMSYHNFMIWNVMPRLGLISCHGISIIGLL